MMSKLIHVKCLVCVSPAGSCYYSGASGLLVRFPYHSCCRGGHSFEATILSLVSHPLWSGPG